MCGWVVFTFTPYRLYHRNLSRRYAAALFWLLCRPREVRLPNHTEQLVLANAQPREHPNLLPERRGGHVVHRHRVERAAPGRARRRIRGDGAP